MGFPTFIMGQRIGDAARRRTGRIAPVALVDLFGALTGRGGYEAPAMRSIALPVLERYVRDDDRIAVLQYEDQMPDGYVRDMTSSCQDQLLIAPGGSGAVFRTVKLYGEPLAGKSVGTINWGSYAIADAHYRGFSAQGDRMRTLFLREFSGEALRARIPSSDPLLVMIRRADESLYAAHIRPLMEAEGYRKGDGYAR